VQGANSGTWFKLYFRDQCKPIPIGKNEKFEYDFLTIDEDKTSTFTHTCNLMLIAEDQKSIMKR
jgi:CheY-like chemotaxis protein